MPYCLPKISQYLSTIWLEGRQSAKFSVLACGGRTPANTLVISSTLMPASGKVGESAAAVAMLRCLEHLERLELVTSLNR